MTAPPVGLAARPIRAASRRFSVWRASLKAASPGKPMPRIQNQTPTDFSEVQVVVRVNRRELPAQHQGVALADENALDPGELFDRLHQWTASWARASRVSRMALDHGATVTRMRANFAVSGARGTVSVIVS